MIYFMVNNNHQYIDFNNHLLELKEREVILIKIPYALDECEDKDVQTVLRYSRPSRSGFVPQVLNFLTMIRRIHQDIVPAKKDVLFFYTEYEILNQYVATLFKQAGARIYLIEDGGFGTYVPFRKLDSEALNVKERVKQAIYRLLPGLSKIRLHKLNGHIFPWMPDAGIDGVCLYKQVLLKRAIPTRMLQRPSQAMISTIPGRVLFLNEPIYDAYQNTVEYINGLEQFIFELCAGFSEVLFKFHPRETVGWRQRIRDQVLIRFPQIIVIEENAAIEILAETYRPSVAASYFCSALQSLSDRGIEPLYLYHLIPDLRIQPVFQEVTSILEDLNYNFVSSLTGINAFYSSGLLHKPSGIKHVKLVDIVDHA